jgi:hypothetical protein
MRRMLDRTFIASSFLGLGIALQAFAHEGSTATRLVAQATKEPSPWAERINLQILVIQCKGRRLGPAEKSGPAAARSIRELERQWTPSVENAAQPSSRVNRAATPFIDCSYSKQK